MWLLHVQKQCSCVCMLRRFLLSCLRSILTTSSRGECHVLAQMSVIGTAACCYHRGFRFGCSPPGPDSAVSRRLGRACCAVPRSEPQVSRSLPPCLRQFRCAGRCGLVLGQLPPMDNGQICRLVFQPDAQPLSVEPGTPLAPRRQPGDAAPPAFAGGCRERPVRRRRPSPRRGGPAPLRPASHAPLRPLGPSSGSSGPSARR